MRSTRLASALFLLLATAAFADTIGGTVTNATTGKPAAGASVTLVDPMGGMTEVATAKADARGRFQIEAPAAKGPRLARAERGGVNYFKMITPGSTNVDLTVYDAAPSVEGISGSADVVRFQTQGSALQVAELFAIKNASNPPRTLASSATFEFVLPEGAQIDSADAQGPNGQPISATTTPMKEKNHHAFSYALKPGETRFQVSYHLPYNGKISLSPRLTRDFEHYVLVIPSSMSFSAKDAKQFQPLNDQPGSNVEVSVRASAGQDLSYALSGTGTIPDEPAEAMKSGDGENGGGTMGGGAAAGGAAADSRPGGGLGKPIDAPDGLANYRWYILGVLLTVLIGGGIWTHERTKQDGDPAAPVSSAAALRPTARKGRSAASSVASPAAPSVASAEQQPPAGSLLLAALKEELFQLEIERQQGKLTPEEYAKAHSAVEQTLQRALARARTGSS